MIYIEEVDKGMKLLADSNTTIIGQAVSYKGHAITRQASFWPEEKRIELPVAEEMQTGIALGMSLTGEIPVSIYPRMNFLICAANQLINHLDKWKLMGGGQPHVILKCVVGSSHPLDPGHQHKADLTCAIRDMCDSVFVYNLRGISNILPAYKNSINTKGIHLIVEHGDSY